MSRKESWKAADVQCPFYLEDNANKIVCEGFGNGMTVGLHFHLMAEKQRYMGIQCVNRYKECPVYIDTMKKYPD